MKQTTRIVALVMSVIVAAGLIFAVPQNVSAGTNDKYNHKYGNKSYGEYTLVKTETDAVSLIRSNFINRNTEFKFYYVKNSISADKNYFKNLTNTALVHDPSTPNAGDYLAKSYDTYTYSYMTFPGGYDNTDLLLVTFKVKYYTTLAEENRLNNSINTVLNELGVYGMSDYDKIATIYNWITNNIIYDFDNSQVGSAVNKDRKAYTAYNAMIKRTAVCQGIATLFYRMLLTCGIDNRIVYWDNHCWNIVKLEGNYYYCDVTWDLGTDYYLYFLAGNTNAFRYDHNLGNQDINLGYKVSSVDYKRDSANISAFVSRLYTVVLGRDAETDGLNYWTNELKNQRIDGATAARSFIKSEEFISKNVSNEEYLRILYSTFFDRQMDDGGRDYWLGQLASGVSKDSVLEGFIYSNEWNEVCKAYGIKSGAQIPSAPVVNTAVRGFAERLYTKALGRDAESEGLDYWYGELVSGRITGTNAAYGFVFSDEYVNAGHSDSEFVQMLYRLFMDREYDQGGYDYWMSKLAAGESRINVFYGFCYSEEFANICDSCGIAR